jgi:hypothetical protein
MPVTTQLALLFGMTFAALHALAEYFSLYWHYWWLDMPMHVFGGIVVVFSLSALLRLSLFPSRLATPLVIGVAIAGVLIVWELFGIYRYGGFKPDFFSDTTLDIVFGILGVLIGGYIVHALQVLE